MNAVLKVLPCEVFDHGLPPAGLQNSAEDNTLKWYKDLQESAARCAQAFEQLNSPKDAMVRSFK